MYCWYAERWQGKRSSRRPSALKFRKDIRADESEERDIEQRGWDSGVMAAAEFVRRYSKDEDLALQIHGLLCHDLPKEHELVK